MLRSKSFSSLFKPQYDKKVDWKQFWVKQLLVIFNNAQTIVALFMFDTFNE